MITAEMKKLLKEYHIQVMVKTDRKGGSILDTHKIIFQRTCVEFWIFFFSWLNSLLSFYIVHYSVNKSLSVLLRWESRNRFGEASSLDKIINCLIAYLTRFFLSEIMSWPYLVNVPLHESYDGSQCFSTGISWEKHSARLHFVTSTSRLQIIFCYSWQFCHNYNNLKNKMNEFQRS